VTAVFKNKKSNNSTSGCLALISQACGNPRIFEPHALNQKMEGKTPPLKGFVPFLPAECVQQRHKMRYHDNVTSSSNTQSIPFRFTLKRKEGSFTIEESFPLICLLGSDNMKDGFSTVFSSLGIISHSVDVFNLG
ncbi:hypothetical protein C0J52_10793, partial [Blattella germanica]